MSSLLSYNRIPYRLASLSFADDTAHNYEAQKGDAQYEYPQLSCVVNVQCLNSEVTIAVRTGLTVWVEMCLF